MAHWLEEIERVESRKNRSARDSARIQDKIFRIKQNYEKNEKVYEGFINKLNSLIERVNNLPMEHREEFGKINTRFKETRLDNKLNYYSSSRRVERMEFRGILHPLKNVHYKHVRVIFFNVAKIMDKVEVEIREELLEKKRRDGQEIPDTPSAHHHSHKPSGESDDRFHQIYYYDMSRLTDDFAFKIIDWLAFHEEVQHIPIVHDGEPRFKE